MFAYVARQPIMDAQKKLFGYELLFRDGEQNCFPDINPDEATSKILTHSHLSLGVDTLTRGKAAFVNFHRDTLMYRFPTSLDPSNVIIEVVETVDVTPTLVSACKHLRGLGYKIALDDYDLADKWEPFLDFVSIVKFDIAATSLAEIQPHIANLKKRGIKLVAERVETQQDFEKFKALGFDYFQGYFFAKPEIVKHKSLNPSVLSMMDLIRISGSTSVNYEELAHVIERDPQLTYLFLRFINNPMVNKRYHIKSLKHAVTFMGEVEVKKFIALMALANLTDSQPAEVTQMSIVRAHFCDLLGTQIGNLDNPNDAFLTGLLSLLDAILELPFSEILAKVPVDDVVREALCGETNILQDCLQLVQGFERGDWKAVRAFANHYKLKQSQLHNLYNQAIEWSLQLEIGD